MKSSIFALSLYAGLALSPAFAWDEINHVSLYLGYADSQHPQKNAMDPCCHPNPFYGSPNTEFVATPLLDGRFDSGFLLIHNGSSKPIIVDSVDVYIGNSHLNPWGTSLTYPLLPGHSKIIGQAHSFIGGDDFDTSEYHCVVPATAAIIKIHFKSFATADEGDRFWEDANKVLTRDSANCGGSVNETQNWTPAKPL